MTVFYLAVSSGVIRILHLGVLLVLVGVRPVPAENLLLGQQRQVVQRRGDIGRHVRAVTLVVRVLSDGLHYRTQVSGKSGHQRVRNGTGSRVCGCVISSVGGGPCLAVVHRCLVRRAEDVIAQVTRLPATVVIVAPMVHVENLAAIGLVAVIATIDQAYICATRQSGLEGAELDAVTLLGAVVVEPQNVHIQSLVDRKRTDGAVDQHSLPVAHAPIGTALTGVRDLPDFSPGLVVQRLLGGHELGGHSHSLIGGGGMVGASRHLDGNGCGAGGLVDVFDGHLVAGHTHGGHAGVAGAGGDSAVAGACNGHFRRQSSRVQRHSACAQCHAASGLANAPGHGLGSGRAIRPHIVSLRSEGGVVTGGVRAGGRAAQGKLCAVVVAPGWSLGVPVVGQRTALSGNV